MTKLPSVSGEEAKKALEQAGWEHDRTKGSHMVMKKAGERLVVTIPKHKQLKTGTLRSIIRDAGLTVEEFEDLL